MYAVEFFSMFEKYSYSNSFNKKKNTFFRTTFNITFFRLNRKEVSDNIKSKGDFHEEIFVDMLYKYNKLLNVRSLKVILIKE
jgi:hypothetical protein